MESLSKKRRRSREEWRSLIEAYHQSRLSKVSFCKEHSLSRSNFYMWERYFVNEKKKEDSAYAPPFIPVTIADSSLTTVKPRIILPNDRIKSGLELENGKGLRLSFANGCSYGELQTVMVLLQNAA